jgi:AcrR family transcriptional regulator
MPKIVDHDRRREEIAALTLAVIRSVGLENASIRTIARHGRISMGVLSHYFNSKDELVGFSFAWLAQRTFAELEVLLAASPPGLARLRTALGYMLPAAGQSQDFALWMTLWGRAVSNASLARQHRAYYARWRRCVRGFLREAQRLGEVPARLSLADATDLLVATVDGLWIDCMMEPRRFGAARRRALLERLLDLVRERAPRPGARRALGRSGGRAATVPMS